MIVWLASYPRSGNTLLRMLIYRTMGLGSYSDESDERGEWKTANPEYLFEHFEIPESDWDTFYRRASTSPDVHLVKTHRPPRDSQPAIHILRDGRNALTSYAHFHRVIERSGMSLLDLALGADHYGSWAEHDLAWTSRTGPMLTISYESMMREPEMLAPRIAEFIGYTGERRPWNNNFSSLQANDPKFFRRASVEWEGNLRWTPFVNGVFFHLQGEAMVRHGYATSEAAEEAVRALPEEALRMSETVRGLLQRQRSSQASLDQRLAVIEEFKSAAGNRLEVNARLKAICDERQVLIEDLKRVCDERQMLIDNLAATLSAISNQDPAAAAYQAEIGSLKTAADERQEVIGRLKAACDERQALIDSLKRVCDERQGVIDDLKRACDERRALIEEFTAALRAR